MWVLLIDTLGGEGRRVKEASKISKKSIFQISVMVLLKEGNKQYYRWVMTHRCML